MNEQVTQENGVEAVQKPQKTKKKRSRSDKIGINKYNQQLLKRCLRGIEDVRTELRWVRHRIDRIGEAEYSVSDVEHFAVGDEVDREIVQRLVEIGVQGALSKDVAAAPSLLKYSLRYYHVARRIVRRNSDVAFETCGDGYWPLD